MYKAAEVHGFPTPGKTKRLTVMQTSGSALPLECRDGCAMRLILFALEISRSFSTRTLDPIFAQSFAPGVHSPRPGWGHSRGKEYV